MLNSENVLITYNFYYNRKILQVCVHQTTIVLPCLTGVQCQYSGVVDAPIHALSMPFSSNKSTNKMFVSLLVSEARPVLLKSLVQIFCELFQFSFNFMMQNESEDSESGKSY